MKHFIIGTAGHVDHGKTMLIKALTGRETDRLKEEKERGISIELGFAPFTLPSGVMAGVIDVPGHERFIKNMLAGVGGMDMVLLVIAADEGIMPQTREHLDIIDLLQVQEGIIVLTKSDLVDRDWMDLVTEEIRELVEGTALEHAPVAEVSSVSGEGINELKQLIDLAAVKLRERSAAGRARMPIDRVFSITGFGSVVTGTLIEGYLQVGTTVELLPENRQARIRGLQVHGQKVEIAEAGQRVAVNLAGLDLEEIDRGSVLALPGHLKPSHRVDVQLKLLPDAEKPLVNRARVRLHIGTSEILGRVVLLEAEELEPGSTAFAQVECEEPVVAARGDLFVIRSYSPMRTIGGGKVIDSSPVKHKRGDPGVIEALRTKEKGTPEDLIQQFMFSSQQPLFNAEELQRGAGLPEEVIREGLTELVSSEMIRLVQCDQKTYYVLQSTSNEKAAELTAALAKYHRTYPLRSGLSKEEIRSRYFSSLNNKLFTCLMEYFQKDGIVRLVGENIAAGDFQPGPGEKLKPVLAKLEAEFANGGFQTPGWDDICARYKLDRENAEEILGYLLNNHILVKLEDDILMHQLNLARAKSLIIEHLQQKGEITLGEVRDMLGTTRKYALPILNYFDKEKVTRRVEDKRVLY